ncbi:MAG: hypothetical protein KGJ57_09160 [Sphingomonadales bacterium]|nr:hypothetical protein [Sphingomonadales bacterium]MDE2169578.1 hypothetical protein [Sphingomonadales bacterium]
MAWAIAGCVVLAIGLRALLFAPLEIGYADELMQYLEQANRLVTGHGIMPWEVRMDARNQIIPQMLAPAMWLGHCLAPGTLWAVWLARAFFAALTLLALPAAWRLGRLTSPRHGLVALFAVSIWYESVLFSELLLSESLASALLVMAAALLLAPVDSARGLRLGGLLLGLGVIVRLQYAPFAAVLLIGACWRHRPRWQAAMMGCGVALSIGALSDLLGHHVPYHWVVQNVILNIGTANRAASFGVEPPQTYVIWLFEHLGPFAPFMLAGAFLAGKAYRPLAAAALVNLLLHSLIAHKEYRFIWLSVLVVVVLSAIASLRGIDMLARRRGAKQASGIAMAVLICAWLIASLAANQQSGGARAMRGGSAITRLAIQASQQPGICGIAIANRYRSHVVPAMLPRDVPLYLIPESVASRNDPLPVNLGATANALIAIDRPRDTQAFSKADCITMPFKQACLFVRRGSCQPHPEWLYQSGLERESL